jgi:hypothetical protein
MILFARVLEAVEHQFLVRACYDGGLVGFGEPGPLFALTVDTVHPVADSTRGFESFRLAIRAQTDRQLQGMLEVITPADCEDILWLLRRVYCRQLGHAEATTESLAIGARLAARLNPYQVGRIDPAFQE